MATAVDTISYNIGSLPQVTLPVMEPQLKVQTKHEEKRRGRSGTELGPYLKHNAEPERARSKSYLPTLISKQSSPCSLESNRSTITKLRQEIDSEFGRETLNKNYLMKASQVFPTKLSRIQTTESERRISPIFYQSHQFTPPNNFLFNIEKPSFVNSESPYHLDEVLAHKEKQESLEKRVGSKLDWVPSSPTKAKKDISRDIFLMYEEKQADKDKIAINLKHFNEKLQKQKYTTKSPISEYY